MRDELHLMELVDRYLDGGMQGEEFHAFEGRIEANGELRALVEDQRALREGLQRVRLRGALATAHRRWTYTRWLPWAAAVILLAVGAAWWQMQSEEHVTLVAEPTIHVDPLPTNAPTSEEGPAPDTLDLSTRVESVFMTTQKVTRQVTDTSAGKGRIVTRLITDARTTQEMSQAAVGDEADAQQRTKEPPASPVPQDEHGAEDRLPSVTKSDSMQAQMRNEGERTLLARVERLQNASKPEYPGGMEEMLRFIESNLKQPRGTRKAGIVTVGFTVNKKGEVVNGEVIQSLGRAFDAEALRVVACMPNWRPSVLGDRPVKSKVQVRVRFLGGVRNVVRK